MIPVSPAIVVFVIKYHTHVLKHLFTSTQSFHMKVDERGALPCQMPAGDILRPILRPLGFLRVP